MSLTSRSIAAVLSLAAMSALGGCEMSDSKPANPKPMTQPMSSDKPMSNDPSMMTKSLYDRLGGEPAIKLVVDEFVARAAPDPKVNFTREGTAMKWDATPENVAMLKKHLVQFIAMATGGPQKYEGRPMKPLHKGMGISNAEFNAIAADLIGALDKYKVPEKEKAELLAVVETTRKDIVEKP